MKIIDRYIFAEMVKVFVLSLFILMSILILEKINFISNMTLGTAMGARELTWLILYTSPAFLIVSIPLAVLLASLITFSRLSADNEIIAMRAGGISFLRILYPVAIVSFLCMAVSGWLAVEVLHQGNYLFNSKIAAYVSRRITSAVSEKAFFDKFPNAVIYVNEKPADGGRIKGIFIYDGRDKKNPRFITAREGILGSTQNNDVILKLDRGMIYSGDAGYYQVISYGTYEMRMDLHAGPGQAFEKGSREMSIGEIGALIRDHRQKNIPVAGDEVELYKRFSLPLASFVLGLLGAPLGVQVHRGGKWGGIGTGIMMIVFNYVLLMVGEGLGRQGHFPPEVAVFLPDIVMGALAAFLIYRVSREAAPLSGLFRLSNGTRAASPAK